MALEIDSLWVYLRMAYDFQAISQGEFQVVSEILYEISEQNKKWLTWSVKTTADNRTDSRVRDDSRVYANFQENIDPTNVIK